MLERDYLIRFIAVSIGMVTETWHFELSGSWQVGSLSGKDKLTEVNKWYYHISRYN